MAETDGTGESTKILLEEILKPNVDPKIKRIYGRIIEDRTDVHGGNQTGEAINYLENHELHKFSDKKKKKRGR